MKEGRKGGVGDIHSGKLYFIFFHPEEVEYNSTNLGRASSNFFHYRDTSNYFGEEATSDDAPFHNFSRSAEFLEGKRSQRGEKVLGEKGSWEIWKWELLFFVPPPPRPVGEERERERR